MTLAEEEISNVTETIWLSILGMPVSPISGIPPDMIEQRAVMGCVHINGVWSGAVVIHCPVSLAHRVAQVMFALGDQHPSESDTQDALGEITNMTGGSIKALLPEPCLLSLPTVVEGGDYILRVPGTSLVTRQVFRCADAAFVVSLLQRDDAAGRSGDATEASRC